MREGEERIKISVLKKKKKMLEIRASGCQESRQVENVRIEEMRMRMERKKERNDVHPLLFCLIQLLDLNLASPSKKRSSI